MALEEFRADMERCSQCSACKWIPFDQIKSLKYAKGCPSIAFSNFNSYSARGRLDVALALLDGRIDYSDRVQDIVFRCLTCGSCDVSHKVCRYDVEPLEVMHELRTKLVQDGQLLPEHMVYIDHLRKEDNMMLAPKSGRGDWANGLDVKVVTEEPAEVIFHAGCRFSYDEELQKIARTAVTLMKEAGVDIGIMGKDEACCGSRAYQMGYEGEYRKFAENSIDAWKTEGVKMVVTSCADCFHAFTRLYPRLGAHFEVLHTTQYLERLINEGKIKFSKSIPMKVTFHDPCHLGRQGEPYVPWDGEEKKIKGQIITYEPPKPRYNGAWGVYDAPRNVLKSIPGIELVEMERIREYAWCCGAGGGAREGYPEFSNWTAAERIDEAKSTGAETIVTACGWCERNFIDAVETAGEKMKVLDIVQLVQQAI
ncbi:MAG: (Fe-S)-binding protein [Thermincola sp.]|jgi:Fe-S oxidoreductase|nr:(Fe-S)-binding protein [Thermincola sp.]MDT3704172.1 (Fe-S)-binding protein [Thermincola sp.]